MRILVVNDELAMRRILRETLERAGHQVIPFTHGAEALKELHTTPADVVITDGTNSPDGIEFVEAVRKVSNVPIIIVSGWAAEFERMFPGIDAYFDIPFIEAELLKCISRLAGPPRWVPSRCQGYGKFK